MTTDDFLLLVHVQWERGLIIPDSISPPELMNAARLAMDYGLCVQGPYSTGSIGGAAKCYSLTKAGWLRLGELTNVEIIFNLCAPDASPE